jgi:hypothetical protein
MWKHVERVATIRNVKEIKTTSSTFSTCEKWWVELGLAESGQRLADSVIYLYTIFFIIPPFDILFAFN